MLYDILKCVVLMSICGGLTTLILFVIKPLTKRFFSARWHCFVGVAALLLFLLPLSYIRLPAASAEKAPARSRPVPAVSTEISSLSSALETARTIPVTIKGLSSAKTPINKSMSNDLNAGEIAGIAYLAGVVAFAVAELIKYLRFLKRLKRRSRSAESGRVSIVFENALLETRIKRRISLALYEGSGTPFLMGIVHPKVFIPLSYANLPDQELRLIFSHELTHCKRGDMTVKALCCIACVLHWFNPLCRMFNTWLNRNLEMACDEAVVNHLEREQRKCYGYTILSSVSFSKIPGREFSAALCSEKSMLKERLDHIMNYHKSGRTIAAVSLCVALTLVFTGYAASQTILKADTAKGRPAAANAAQVKPCVDLSSSQTQDSAIDPAASAQIETYTKRIEDFLDRQYNAGSSDNYAISDVSVADKGAITAAGGMSVERISDKIADNVHNYCQKKFSSLFKPYSHDNGSIQVYMMSYTSYSTDWNTDSASKIRVLADVFSNRAHDGSTELPVYVIYLDKNGQPQAIRANDENLNKAKSGIDPIPD